MNINIAIEKLLKYASVHLLLAEEDEIYARNRLVEILRLKGCELYEVDEDEIFEQTSPQALLKPLSEYALKNGIAAAAESFEAGVIDLLALSPSALAVTFDDLYNISAVKAFDWLREYNALTGYIAGDARLIKANELSVLSLNDNGVDLKRRRSLSLPLSEELIWSFTPYRQFTAAGKLEKPGGEEFFASDLPLLNEFLAYAPYDFVGFKSGGSYAAAGKELALFEAATDTPLSSELYPALKINLLDWYCPAFRISGNLFETASLAGELIKEGGSVFLRRHNGDVCCYVTCQSENGVLPGAGVVILGKEEAALKTISKFLTGAAIFNESNLTDEVRVHTGLIKELTAKYKGLKEDEAFEVTLAAYFGRGERDIETFLASHALS